MECVCEREWSVCERERVCERECRVCERESVCLCVRERALSLLFVTPPAYHVFFCETVNFLSQFLFLFLCFCVFSTKRFLVSKFSSLL